MKHKARQRNRNSSSSADIWRDDKEGRREVVLKLTKFQRPSVGPSGDHVADRRRRRRRLLVRRSSVRVSVGHGRRRLFTCRTGLTCALA